MPLEAVRALIAKEMDAVDATIAHRLRSEVALINQLGHYIVNSGGKRLRPQLVLLSAGAAGYAGSDQIQVAAIIELIHTATLLHDDVVDASDLRRGQDTANAVWGNEAAVLVGDFLYSRAFEMMVEAGSMRVMEILSHTTNTIAEGEVMQLLNVHDADTSEARYIEVIQCKTAKLFEAACELGGVLAELPLDQQRALARYGMHLGTAFQLIDDVLDYSADARELGKNLGDDLAEGKPTLPLIRAMQVAAPQQAALLREAIERGGREMIEPVMVVLRGTDAIDYSRAKAQSEAGLAAAALEALQDNRYSAALRELADYSVARHF